MSGRRKRRKRTRKKKHRARALERFHKKACLLIRWEKVRRKTVVWKYIASTGKAKIFDAVMGGRSTTCQYVEFMNYGFLYGMNKTKSTDLYCETMRIPRYRRGKGPSHASMAAELAAYFCQGVKPTRLRKEESAVMKRFVLQQHPVCHFAGTGDEVVVATDVLQVVLEYLDKTYALIVSLGLTCHDWFVNVLFSWRSHTFSMGRVSTIPLAVLSQLSTAVLSCHTNTVCGAMEWTHLATSTTRLAHLTIGDLSKTRCIGVVRSLFRCKDCPFVSLTSLTFEYRNPAPGQRIDAYVTSSPCVDTIAPSLTEAYNLPWCMIEGCIDRLKGVGFYIDADFSQTWVKQLHRTAHVPTLKLVVYNGFPQIKFLTFVGITDAPVLSTVTLSIDRPLWFGTAVICRLSINMLKLPFLRDLTVHGFRDVTYLPRGHIWPTVRSIRGMDRLVSRDVQLEHDFPGLVCVDVTVPKYSTYLAEDAETILRFVERTGCTVTCRFWCVDVCIRRGPRLSFVFGDNGAWSLVYDLRHSDVGTTLFLLLAKFVTVRAFTRLTIRSLAKNTAVWDWVKTHLWTQDTMSVVRIDSSNTRRDYVYHPPGNRVVDPSSLPYTVECDELTGGVSPVAGWHIMGVEMRSAEAAIITRRRRYQREQWKDTLQLRRAREMRAVLSADMTDKDRERYATIHIE